MAQIYYVCKSNFKRKRKQMNIEEFSKRYTSKLTPIRERLTSTIILKLAYEKGARRRFYALTKKEQLTILISGIARIIMSLEHLKTILESVKKHHK